MHDVKALRDDPAAFERGWSLRGMADAETVVADLRELDRQLRAAQAEVQAKQARRNDLSKLVGAAKGRKDEAEAQRLMAEVEALKAGTAEAFEREGKLGRELRKVLEGLPNLPAADVPEGPDETANVEVRRCGSPRDIASPKDHVDLGEGLGLMDFEAAAKMSGARFVVLKGQLARLERALGQFMLDLHTGEHGYAETSPPILVRDEAMFGTGQLPKFKNDLFFATNMLGLPSHESEEIGDASVYFEHVDFLRINANRRAVVGVEGFGFQTATRRWLIPTAEVSLTNLVREATSDEASLPLRLTALTHCFRAEAGASGRDTRGMIRQHQFQKVELVSITTPEQSAEEHERMTACAETVLQRLGLPYRTMLLCTGDMGFSARKTYDIEVWLPSAGAYREISSCSACGDFQARRMDARIQKRGEKGTRFPHTLNGSGTAVGRALVAVLENYQDEGGRIAVPDVLVPYMGGLTHIEGAGRGAQGAA